MPFCVEQFAALVLDDDRLSLPLRMIVLPGGVLSAGAGSREEIQDICNSSVDHPDRCYQRAPHARLANGASAAAAFELWLR